MSPKRIFEFDDEPFQFASVFIQNPSVKVCPADPIIGLARTVPLAFGPYRIDAVEVRNTDVSTFALLIGVPAGPPIDLSQCPGQVPAFVIPLVLETYDVKFPFIAVTQYDRLGEILSLLNK